VYIPQTVQRGLRPGWFMDVEPVQFWLEPGEKIEGLAIIRDDSSVPPWSHPKENPIPIITLEAIPIITLEALAEQGDTWVPFGDINIEIQPKGDIVVVRGNATTSAGDPVGGANVSLRILKSDKITEIDIYHTLTNMAGHFNQVINQPSNLPPGESLYLEAVLSPTLSTGPAETNKIKFVFNP
jgi:hypothetical protein